MGMKTQKPPRGVKTKGTFGVIVTKLDQKTVDQIPRRMSKKRALEAMYLAGDAGKYGEADAIAKKYGLAGYQADISIEDRPPAATATKAFEFWFRNAYKKEPNGEFEPLARHTYFVQKTAAWNAWRTLSTLIYQHNIPFKVHPKKATRRPRS